MFNNVICWLIIIFSSTAFQIAGLGKGDRVMELLGIGIILVLLILNVVYNGNPSIKINYKFHFTILIGAALISCAMAEIVYNQPFSLTLYQSRAIFFYFFYFLLHYLAPNPKYIEKALVTYGIIYCILYIIQTLVYPTLVTEARVFFDRGTLRIFMPGGMIMLFAYFIAFDKIFEKFSWHYLIFLILSLIVAFLLGTRQILVSLILLSLANIFINKKIKSRITLLIVFFGVIALTAFLMRETIEEMIALTYKHKDEKDGYIRVRAAEYFLTEFPENKAVYIFGNGEPTERSSYGVSMAKISNTFGFYLSDIGLIAIYFKYGIFFSIICLILIFNALFKKLHSQIMYIKYYFVMVLIMLVTSQLPFEISEGIVVVSFIFYFIDFYLNHRENSNVIEIGSP